MTLLTCPHCDGEQDVELSVDVYFVVCQYCGTEFDIPRRHRVNKRTVREWKSAVDVYVRTERLAQDKMEVIWRVEGTSKDVVYEQDSVMVDVSSHETAAYGIVGLVRALQGMQTYNEGRVWVDDGDVVDILAEAGDERVGRVRERALSLLRERFVSSEVGVCSEAGRDRMSC